jgi:hypothetical protein
MTGIMQAILYFAAAFAAAGTLFFGLKLLAARIGPMNEAAARAAFGGLKGFSPGPVHAYLGSAIGYDPARNTIAIWEKRGGARLVHQGGVSEWHAGMMLTQVLSRTTATRMLQLYSRADSRPFFKVGVLRETDCAAWRDRLQAAFGGEKERTSDARILGA